MASDVDGLVKMLTRVRYERERGDGPGGSYYYEPCDADDDGAEAVPVNPDGEAAASALISERDARVKAEKEREDFAELVVKIQRQFEEYAFRSEAAEAKLAEALEGHQHESATMAALLERAEAKLADAVKVIEGLNGLIVRAQAIATDTLIGQPRGLSDKAGLNAMIAMLDGPVQRIAQGAARTFLASLKEPSHG